MFAKLYSWWRPDTSSYCKQDFPEVWSSFVDCFIDSIHAQGVAASPPSKQHQSQPHPTFLPPAARIVAIGDLHGDLNKTKRAFRLGGLTDEQNQWVGGQTTAVQVGDQLDRGDQELEILYFLERLQKEAARAGGALYVLNGNHETMNVAGRFRYATAGGINAFYQWHVLQSIGAGLKAKCGCGPGSSWSGNVPPNSPKGSAGAVAARIAAFMPGGPVTQRFLARNPIVLQIGSTVFVHGGVLPDHVEYGLARINMETQEWMLGQQGGEMPKYLAGRQALVWARDYSAQEESLCDCDTLQQALSMIPGARQMVVGHTIQEGINSACKDQVYRVDVGMSTGCGNSEPEVLEILNDKVIRRLREGGKVEVLNGPDKAVAEPNADLIRRFLRLL